MYSPCRLLLPLFLLIALPLAAADTVDIKPRWVSGKKYFFESQIDQLTTVNAGPQKVENHMTMTTETSVVVRPHPEGRGQRLTVTQDHVAVEITILGKKASYDSAAPNESTGPASVKAMGALVGKEVRVLTDAAGAPVEMENYEEFMNSFPASSVSQMVDLRKIYPREVLLQPLQSLSLAAPGKPVSTGESWPFTRELQPLLTGRVAIQGTYTFRGLADRAGTRCAVLQTKGAMATAPISGPAVGAPAKTTEVSLQGQVWFDLTLGAMRESRLTQVVKIAMKNPADPAGPSVDVPTTQVITTTLKKIEDVK
jgi:hypothetical protein